VAGGDPHLCNHVDSVERNAMRAQEVSNETYRYAFIAIYLLISLIVYFKLYISI
jgi:hypothetical protein